MDGWDWVVGWGGNGVGVGWRLRVGGPCNSVRRVPITACKLRGLESPDRNRKRKGNDLKIDLGRGPRPAKIHLVSRKFML